MLGFVGNMITSIFGGALIAVGVVVGVYMFFMLCDTRYRLNVSHILLYVLLFCFMLAQGTMFVGALKVKSYTEDAKEVMLGYLNAQSDAVQAVSQIHKDYPIIASFVDNSDIVAELQSRGEGVCQLPDALIAWERAYMWRRVAWMGGALLVGVLMLGITKTSRPIVRNRRPARNVRHVRQRNRYN